MVELLDILAPTRPTILARAPSNPTRNLMEKTIILDTGSLSRSLGVEEAMTHAGHVVSSRGD